MPTKKAKADPEPVILNIDIHPALRRELKSAAAPDEMTMSRKLHEILCNALDRTDLLDELPASASA